MDVPGSNWCFSGAHRGDLVAAKVIPDVLDGVQPDPNVKLDVMYSGHALQSQGLRLSWLDTSQAPTVRVSHTASFSGSHPIIKALLAHAISKAVLVAL